MRKVNNFGEGVPFEKNQILTRLLGLLSLEFLSKHTIKGQNEILEMLIQSDIGV